MKKIVKTQKQLDAIKKNFEGTIYIKGGDYYNSLILRTNFDHAIVVAWDSSYVVAWDSSHVEARDSSHVVARDSSHVVARDSSYVEAWDSSRHDIYGKAMITAFSCEEIVCHGYNMISLRKENEENVNIVLNKTSILKIIPTFKATWADFLKRFPIKVKGTKAILYKAVHKIGEKYFSDYDKSFKYEIGKIYKHNNAPKSGGACAEGLHVAEKSWAKSFGFGWEDYALLECEVPIKSIIVSGDSDGKVRTSQLKVLREVADAI